jgi:hypothetical protein
MDRLPIGSFGGNPGSPLSFVAVVVDDDQSRATGIVSVVPAVPGKALRIIQPFADPDPWLSPHSAGAAEGAPSREPQAT